MSSLKWVVEISNVEIIVSNDIKQSIERELEKAKTALLNDAKARGLI